MKPTRDLSSSSQRMGSTNQPQSHTPVVQTQRSNINGSNVLSNKEEEKVCEKRGASHLSNYSLTNNNGSGGGWKQMIITTIIDNSKVTFMVNPRTKQLQIKCIMQKGKKYISSYLFDNLPKAIQVTYKSMQQLFEDIKYIVEQNVPNRLSLDKNGKIIFTLETKKKGKPEYLPQMFQMEEQSDEKVIARLEGEIEQLKVESNKKQQRIDLLESRLQQIERMLKIAPGKNVNKNNNNNNNKNINNQPYPQNYPLSQMNTIQTGLNDTIQNTSTIQRDQQQSIIKRFKRSKSNENLQLLKKLSQGGLVENQHQTLLKTTIGDYDVFVEFQSQEVLGVQILSRKQAKIYKCHITKQTIPKQVYSFVPTPKQLHEEISYIIRNNLKNRLDVKDNNFIYRASINTKNKQTLVDGVFETEMVRQDEMQRIEGLVDLRATAVEEKVKEIERRVDMLRQSLQSNDIILQMPIGFIDSKIIQTNAQFITLCKFFTKKIFKISLLYRASQYNFQIKKFHQLCDNIPNTLTIVNTYYDKVIGGFTSELWDKNGNGKSVSDYAGHSFIFSLTNRHKFVLEQHEHAIQTGVEDGPRFGNGADLVIKDKANENNNSYANICTSYTHPRYIYKNSQSYKMFSGDDKTNRFMVKQWQVFEVFFQQ